LNKALGSLGIGDSL